VERLRRGGGEELRRGGVEGLRSQLLLSSSPQLKKLIFG
jgi:hypothetical protein